MDFQKRNITTTRFAIFLEKGIKQVDAKHSVPVVSKINFTFTEILLTYLNFSIHRSAMHLFV
jgi:hypothetical protein